MSVIEREKRIMANSGDGDVGGSYGDYGSSPGGGKAK